MAGKMLSIRLGQAAVNLFRVAPLFCGLSDSTLACRAGRQSIWEQTANNKTPFRCSPTGLLSLQREMAPRVRTSTGINTHTDVNLQRPFFGAWRRGYLTRV